MNCLKSLYGGGLCGPTNYYVTCNPSCKRNLKNNNLWFWFLIQCQVLILYGILFSFFLLNFSSKPKRSVCSSSIYLASSLIYSKVLSRSCINKTMQIEMWEVINNCVKITRCNSKSLQIEIPHLRNPLQLKSRIRLWSRYIAYYVSSLQWKMYCLKSSKLRLVFILLRLVANLVKLCSASNHFVT